MMHANWSKVLVIGFLDLALASGASAQAASDPIVVARAGSQRSFTGPAANFTGSVRVDPIFQARGQSRASASYVSFEPGAHTAWHTHPLGQVLVVTAGVGRVQRWGDAVDEICVGDVVWIPAGVKHWQGASPNTAMTHIAVVEQLNGSSVQWMEKLTPAQYGAALRVSTATVVAAPARSDSQTAGQRATGDIAPKLAQLTDDVLYGDVWERAGLSRRDRSLVTVSALVAMNRPDQLRSHLNLARQNGVTQEELVEAITHLAFYAGWPSAVTAVGVAREVFRR
jgi:4-carboxymuconolactone decarboxylase